MFDFKYIFTDFDGTISKYDVIHRFITNYSEGDWTITEKQWARGEISSEECLRAQMGMIEHLKKETFEEFINAVEIDETFVEFYNVSKQKGVQIVVLSDGFDYFIKTVLEKYGIYDIKIFSNHVELGGKNGFMTFDISFPNYFKPCLINSGTCKCNVAQSFAKDIIYVGDGLSDRCIAKKAKLLFAKKSLIQIAKDLNLEFHSFNNFSDIQKIIYENKVVI